MKTLITLFSAVTVLAFFHFQLLVWAAPSGQYSINFHFVPPILNENCTLGSFWEPTNIRCARCICMTGRISRCFPKGGKCNPTQNDTSISTTTARPDGSSTTVPTTLPTEAPGPVPPNGQSSAAPATSTAAPTTATSSTAAPAAKA